MIDILWDSGILLWAGLAAAVVLPRLSKAFKERQDGKVVAWLAVAVAVGWWLSDAYQTEVERRSLRPVVPVYHPQPAYQPGSVDFGEGGSGDFTGYENPAPGDDGSDDCAPGQSPVYVGANDPSGLDGDGDGIGCE